MRPVFARNGWTPDFPSVAERSNATGRTGNDAAFARLELEMATMGDTLGGLSHEVADAASDISSGGQGQVNRGLNHARANVGSMVNDASDRLGVVANRANTLGGGSLEDAIQERPLATLALAVGLGFLAGVMWRR
jgi:ElaB/YqjD/DUF883 family membrane-anchored ribosome-binding protein